LKKEEAEASKPPTSDLPSWLHFYDLLCLFVAELPLLSVFLGASSSQAA